MPSFDSMPPFASSLFRFFLRSPMNPPHRPEPITLDTVSPAHHGDLKFATMSFSRRASASSLRIRAANIIWESGGTNRATIAPFDIAAVGTHVMPAVTVLSPYVLSRVTVARHMGAQRFRKSERTRLAASGDACIFSHMSKMPLAIGVRAKKRRTFDVVREIFRGSIVRQKRRDAAHQRRVNIPRHADAGDDRIGFPEGGRYQPIEFRGLEQFSGVVRTIVA
jgi:hypothetical protein